MESSLLGHQQRTTLPLFPGVFICGSNRLSGAPLSRLSKEPALSLPKGGIPRLCPSWDLADSQLRLHAACLPARAPSILRNSSAENFRFFSAATLSSTCDTLLVPTSALVTRGSRSTHATAISARVWPRCFAISLRARILVSLSSPISFFFRKKSRAARESLGIPWK